MGDDGRIPVILVGNKCDLIDFSSMEVCLFYFPLTLYHTILTFKDSRKRKFFKTCGRKRKLFGLFSTLCQEQISSFGHLFLSSANTFNLDQFEILLFGTGLI